MRFLRAIRRILLAALWGAAIGQIGIVLYRGPTFDRSHPDYAHFAANFEAARRAFADGKDWAVIDLAPVEGGAWKTACLFGGYTRPVKRMEELGAVVSLKDRLRLEWQGFDLRLSSVEEYEMLIAVLDTSGEAHFIHFDEGVGAEGQHFEACVTKPRTRVAIANGRTEPPSTPAPRLD